MQALSIDAERLHRELTKLAMFTEPDSRGVTRRLGSSAYRESRAWLAGLMAEAGLVPHIDAAANLIGRREGREPGRRAILVGSHTDTVVDGGAFDGALGVLGALEAVRALRDADVQLVHPLEVIDFLSEEVSEFGLSAVGSRAMAGTLRCEWLALRASSGLTLAEAIASMGGAPDRLADATRSADSAAAYVELHIEQGPLLWDGAIQIGVVTGIVGVRRYRAAIDGRSDHAGTTPMGSRRDALAGAAEVILLIERHASVSGPPIVGTVGQIVVSPNSSNVIAGAVQFIFELRGPDEGQLDHLADAIMTEANALASTRRLGWRCEPSGFVPAVSASSHVMRAIEGVAASRGYSTMRMYSGAGHDASHMAAVAATGMVFVPCRDGRSHCPEEYTALEHARSGVDVLAHAIVQLDRQLQ